LTNVFVLDGNQNQAVACVRSLGRAGYSVRVGSDSRWSKAGLSRFSRSQFEYPAPQLDGDAFVAAIVREVSRLGGGLVLPMTERTTLPLSFNRSRLTAVGASVVLPDHSTVLKAFDKAETTRIAASLGVRTPQSKVVSSLDEARQFAMETGFPVVVKGRSSETLSAKGAVVAGGAPSYARTETELADAFQRFSRYPGGVLIQEYVRGNGAGYFALMDRGQLRAEFAHRRIRDVRPTGSGSSLRESAPIDARIRNAGLGILQALGWHGVAMVEFKIDAAGDPVFLEVNGRFWNSLPLAVYAGVDFPAMLARLSEGTLPQAPPAYRVGVRCRWLLGDFRHLVEVLIGPPRGYPGTFPRRLPTLRAFLQPVRGTFHDNFELSDPLPEIGDWLDFVFHRLIRPKGSRAA
jgi:predicted ATP-grasp superfamily ATP-dependent carboligase